MRKKGEVASILQNFVKMEKNQFGKDVKIIRSDNGLKFKSRYMVQLYSEKGILHQTSCIYTHQQNGWVDKKHRHILNIARAFRFQAYSPL